MSATAYPPNGTHREAAASIRRYVNDEIARVATRLDANDGSEFEFVCECGDLGCKAPVRMTLAAYRASRPGSLLGH